MTNQATPEMPAPIFDVREVTYQYRQVRALDGVSLQVHCGERCALLGANGSGKSTLLRLLDGLDYPQKGTVHFCGAPLSRERLGEDDFRFEFRRRVGLVFQNPDIQLFCPSVFDEVAFGPLQLRWQKKEVLRRVSDMLEELEITHLKDRSPHQLSIGEKKRVALASVLVVDPEILLLDEPTASLDPRSESQMIHFLAGCKESRKTVVIATHDLGLLREIADQCYVIENGRTVAQAAPSALLADTALLERAHLIPMLRNTRTAILSSDFIKRV